MVASGEGCARFRAVPGPLNEQRLLRYAPAIVVLVGAVLFLPMLGGIGFWDPYEIRIADGARHVATDGVTPPANLPPGTPSWLAPQLGRPPLWVTIPALGMKALGVSEFGARAPIAVCSILVLVAA